MGLARASRIVSPEDADADRLLIMPGVIISRFLNALSGPSHEVPASTASEADVPNDMGAKRWPPSEVTESKLFMVASVANMVVVVKE
jgi:hypothetical protein